MTIKYLDSKRISGLSLTYAYNVTTGGGQFNGMASNAPSGGVRARQGVKILSNFSDIGKKVQDITIGIRKNGTVSGTVNVQYINSSYTVLATASMNASELGTGTDDTYDFTLSSEVTIADGDRLLLQYSATAWSNGVVLNGASGTRPTGTDYTYEGTLNSNSFTDGSGSGVPMMTFGGADIKPTNVQDNSIFVETDTARRYWFDDATTLTFEDDLSSSTNWAGLSGAFSYDATNDEIDFNADTSGSSAYWNLGSTLSDTAWVMRMKVRLDTFSATSANMQNFTIGLSSTNGAYNTTQDSIGMLIRADGAGSKYKSTWGNDTSQNGNTSNFTRTPSAETIYLEIIRTSATGFTVNQYSDTAYSTLLESKVVTGVTATALQYVKLTTYSEATTNNMVGAITDVKVYDEATSVTPATWTMQPTFEDGLTNYSSTSSSVDLTGSTLSDSWVFRFKLTMTAKSNGIVFMVQDNTSTTVTTPRDGIGLRQTDTTNYYDFEGSNNVGGNAGQYDHRFSSTAPALDTKYIQITRISATQAKIEFYDSTYTTVSETSGDITIANIDNLRYFVVSSNTSTFSIDDVEFYNGVTTIN